MKSVVVGVALCCLFLSTLVAQPYMESRSQHRFARSYLGVNALFSPVSGTLYHEERPETFPSFLVPRITVGGLHFWGRWDFKLSFPLNFDRQQELDEQTTLSYQPGGDLAARYYPWQLEFGKLRPFAGLCFSQHTLRLQKAQIGERSDFFPVMMLHGGLSLAKNDWQLNADVNWLPLNRKRFYTPEGKSREFALPPLAFSLGLIRYFDVTLVEERRKRSGQTARLEKQLKKEKKLNSLSLGLAPSASYFLQAPKLRGVERASLPQHKVNLNWDFGLGYLLHDAKAHVGLSYRNYRSGVESYGRGFVIRRRSIALEGYKLIWDYNGFVPFIGPSLSLENWAMAEFVRDAQLGETRRTQKLSLGIIFGWDIVASPLETWILRTNLRYYPFQSINSIDNDTVRVDQFEFNFIQLVLYPQRMLAVGRRG